MKDLSLLACEWRYSPATGSTGFASKSFSHVVSLHELSHRRDTDPWRRCGGLVRLCDAFFLFSAPRTAKGRVGRANDLVHVYYASISGWPGPLTASPLVYVEAAIGLRLVFFPWPAESAPRAIAA